VARLAIGLVAVWIVGLVVIVFTRWSWLVKIEFGPLLLVMPVACVVLLLSLGLGRKSRSDERGDWIVSLNGTQTPPGETSPKLGTTDRH